MNIICIGNVAFYFYFFSDLIMQRVWSPHLWPDITWNMTKIGQKSNNNIKIMKKFTIDVVKKRYEEMLREKSNGKQEEKPREENDNYITSKRRLAFLGELL